MKKIVALLLALLFLFGAVALPVSADNRIDLKYCVFWAYGSIGEYYLDPARYSVGEIPPVPDIVPYKNDETRLFHFIGWDKEPEPVKEDSFYYAMYEVYDKKYAMDEDTLVSIADVTLLLSILAGEEHPTTSSTDISQDDSTNIQDVTVLLMYLATYSKTVISAQKLLEEEWAERNQNS